MQILEGARFAQMRRIIDNTADIAHDTRGWSDEKLMAEVAPDALSSNPEGQFFPDSYEIDAGGSDLQIYKIAYRKCGKTCKKHGTTVKAACLIKIRTKC